MKKIGAVLLIFALIFIGYFFIKTPNGMPMVGKNLPKLTVQFLKEQIDISGKPVMIDFWGVLCPPCIESMPHLNEIYKKYQLQGLEVIGITIDDKETVEKFLEQRPVDYRIAIDKDSKYSDIIIPEGNIPHIILANRKGKIVWEGHPVDLRDSDIEKILK